MIRVTIDVDVNLCLSYLLHVASYRKEFEEVKSNVNVC